MSLEEVGCKSVGCMYLDQDRVRRTSGQPDWLTESHCWSLMTVFSFFLIRGFRFQLGDGWGFCDFIQSLWTSAVVTLQAVAVFLIVSNSSSQAIALFVGTRHSSEKLTKAGVNISQPVPSQTMPSLLSCAFPSPCVTFPFPLCAPTSVFLLLRVRLTWTFSANDRGLKNMRRLAVRRII